MHLIRKQLDRVRALQRDGADTGAVLVAVVVVMLLGFLIAVTIAATVVFTIGANASNRSNTQAFIAAESGRDVAVATISAGIEAGDGTIDCTSGIAVPGDTSAEHGYSATVRWATSTQPPSKWGSIQSGADSYSSCPTGTSTAVVIHSTGTANGQTSQIDSVYPWSIQPDTRPAGTLAYFDTQFTATKSTYQGDLVIRGSDNYKCNNGASNAIQGDLWVTNASVDVTGDCYVTGSIYAYGYVDASNKNLHVGGSIFTQSGNITLTSNGVVIGGQIYAGRDVTFTKDGTVGHIGGASECAAQSPPKGTGCLVGGTVKAVGSVTSPIPDGWKTADGNPVVGQPGQPTPQFTPTLQAVHDATAWLELDESKGLAQDSVVYPNSSVPDVCGSANLRSILETAGSRAFVDLSSCVSGNAVTINPDASSVVRDVLVYVPSTTTMKVNLSTNLSNGNGALNEGKGPELLLVHGDANINSQDPSCATGADSISVSAAISVRTMIYSPCGITSTISLTMTGQIYAGVNGIHLNGGTFTCAQMGWAPAFKNLACGVTGDSGVFDPNRTTQLIGTALAYQTEL